VREEYGKDSKDKQRSDNVALPIYDFYRHHMAIIVSSSTLVACLFIQTKKKPINVFNFGVFYFISAT
jgi:hypothetical protein